MDWRPSMQNDTRIRPNEYPLQMDRSARLATWMCDNCTFSVDYNVTSTVETELAVETLRVHNHLIHGNAQPLPILTKD